VSNRTIAIIASIMAAVSFAHESVRVSLNVTTDAPRCSAGCSGPHGSALEVTSDGLIVHFTTEGRAVDLLVAITLPNT
jgi:hypothetical protein